MHDTPRYDLTAASAWIRGRSMHTGSPALPAPLLQRPLEALSEAEKTAVVEAGMAAGLKLYPFKRDKKPLGRVQRTLGFLWSVQPESLLDIGSGRGVFLLPFLREFPRTEVTSLDLLEPRVRFLRELRDGGFSRLRPVQGDICCPPFGDERFDVVTMLEVLEHIPEVERAVAAGAALCRRYVVVSVPSKPDDNPEHIHLLTRERLTEMFHRAGCDRLHFDGVEGHLFLVASKSAPEQTKTAREGP